MKKFLLFLFASTSLFADTPFFVLTVPKSGTHMMHKVFDYLTEKKHGPLSVEFPVLSTFFFYDDCPPLSIPFDAIEKQCLYWRENQFYPSGHLNFAEPMLEFSQAHPEYNAFIHIRDLRDVLVSQTFWEEEIIELEIGPCSFDDKLMFIINLGLQPKTNYIFLNIYKNVERALWWKEEPNALFTRYEDFVGEKGGADRYDQENAIIEMADNLQIPLTQEKLNFICENIFGRKGGPTFRSGQIGDWKKYFNEDHKKAFKEIYGDMLIELGYEVDHDW